jgi:hypothetical protein
MSIDFLLSREYDRKAYNCLHFAADAWEHLTGDLRMHQVDEHDFHAGRMSFLFRDMRRQRGPTVQPSIVLMETLVGDAHIGVCIRQRLLHLYEGGAQFLLVDALTPMYRNMRFYS